MIITKNNFFNKEELQKIDEVIKESEPKDGLVSNNMGEGYKKNTQFFNEKLSTLFLEEERQNFIIKSVSCGTFRISTIMASEYKKGDFYGNHADIYGYTVLVWFFKEPKRFNGGDFMLLGPNKLIECKHNRLVMIPSYYMHSVTPITMEEKYRNKGLGRYTLTHFYFVGINGKSL